MSTATVAPSEANAEPVFPAHADPVFPAHDADSDTRFRQRQAAEQALTDLERAVQHLCLRLSVRPSLSRRTIPRRSRRSAWLPSDY